MASIDKSHPLNTAGPLFTDTTCIDCGTCYHIAPTLFVENEKDEKSIVVKQPHGPKEWLLAKMSILSCPTNSIGVNGPDEEFKNLPSGLPLRIEENVFYNGYTSRASFGATSYFIKRDEGNMLVDSPKFHPWLVKEFEKMGGVKYMFLSHQDDVADHRKFHEHFGCQRIIHVDDITADTEDCEIILTGNEDRVFEEDFLIITTPGHSKGHLNLLYRKRFLFTGDHLFVDQEKKRLRASRNVCWYSWPLQIQSMEKLTKENFEWIMPGHGGWGYFGVKDSQIQLADLIERMKGKG